MENFARSMSSSSCSGGYQPKGVWHSVAGHDNTKQFKRRHLFYRTFHPLLSTLASQERSEAQNPSKEEEEEEEFTQAASKPMGSVCSLPNALIVESLSTPESLQISIHERLEDLSHVRRRLDSLKTVFNVSM